MPRRLQTFVVGTLVVLMSLDMAQACRCWRARNRCVAPCAVACYSYTTPVCCDPTCHSGYSACGSGYHAWSGGCDACGNGPVYYGTVDGELAAPTPSDPSTYDVWKQPSEGPALPAVDQPDAEQMPAVESAGAVPAEQSVLEPAPDEATTPPAPTVEAPAPLVETPSLPPPDAAASAAQPSATPGPESAAPPAANDTTPEQRLGELFDEPESQPEPADQPEPVEEDAPKSDTEESLDGLFDESTGSQPARQPLAGGLASRQLRRWTDNTGVYSCQGRLLEITSGTVRLLKANGRTTMVPRTRLSAADARFVHAEAIAAAHRTPADLVAQAQRQ